MSYRLCTLSRITVHVLTPTYTVCDQLLWKNDYGCTHAFLLWGGPSTHPQNLFQYLLFKYCIIYGWILHDIGRNSLLGNRKKIAKFLMSTFTYRSTFLYGPTISWGESRILFLSVLINCRAGDCFYHILKRPHHKMSKKPSYAAV